MRIVVDTNVWISGLLWRGLPWKLLRLAEAKEIELCMAPAMIEELAQVLSYTKLQSRLEQLGLSSIELLTYAIDLVSVFDVPQEGSSATNSVIKAVANSAWEQNAVCPLATARFSRQARATVDWKNLRCASSRRYCPQDSGAWVTRAWAPRRQSNQHRPEQQFPQLHKKRPRAILNQRKNPSVAARGSFARPGGCTPNRVLIC